MIQGQDPAEIQRLAASTQGQLNDRMKVYLDHLTELHKQAAQEQTADALNAIKKQIDAAEGQVDTVNKVMRAHEIAANRAQNAWKGTLEVMENISVATQFSYNVISGGLGRLKDLAESIDKVTNVYGSLKGSIDEIREASKGEVSDFDLITTKNRALEKDLKLTDAQFGAVAASADAFADAIGTNTKDALNQMIDGLATGRVKMLEHAGIVVNVEQAYRDYARTIGVAVDQLSEHGKKIAIVRASLKAMDEKLASSGVGIDDFSHQYEKMTAEMKNHTDQMLLVLGQFGVKLFELFELTIPRAINVMIASMKDAAGLAIKIIDALPLVGGAAKSVLGEGSTSNVAQELAWQKMEDAARARADQQGVKDAQARLASGTAYDYQQGSRSDSINMKKVGEDAKKAEEEVNKLNKTLADFEMMLRGGKKEGVTGLDVVNLTEGQRSHDLDMAFDPSGSLRAAPVGLSGSTARTNALQKAMEKKQEFEDADQQRLAEQAFDALEQATKDNQKELKDKADQLREKAGGGIFAQLLFGEAGPDQLIDNLEAFKNSAATIMGMVTDAGMKMADALGASLAAMVSGDKASKSLRQQTHDILEALATQAYAKAIFETAEGLAMTALALFGVPIAGPSAAAHFAAAAMYGAVGTAAAIGARGVGNPGAAAGPSQEQKWQQQHDTSQQKKQWEQANGYTAGTSTTGSGFGSNGQRNTTAANTQGPVSITINVNPGGEAEAGRQVDKALRAFYSETGLGPSFIQQAAA